jgi:HPt (histidine-containing phosphotransfer) domain-containing protein
MFEKLEDNAISKLLNHPEFVGLPSLDINTFQELRETIGDDGVFCDLVTIYFNSAETLIDAVQLALINQDTDKFTLAAHSLKSTSASIGASRLAKICKRLEKTDNMEGLTTEIIDLLNNEYEQAITAIKILVLELI